MTLGETYYKTFIAHSNAEDALMDWVDDLFACGDFNAYEDIWVDATDWDGMSLELKKASRQIVPTRAQCNRAYEEQGFDVIDIEYDGDSAHPRRFYPDATRDRHQRFALETMSNYILARVGDDSEGWAA